MLPIAINCLYIFTTLYTLFSHRLLLSVVCLCFEKNRNCFAHVDHWLSALGQVRIFCQRGMVYTLYTRTP